jgi:hypothetical protein
MQPLLILTAGCVTSREPSDTGSNIQDKVLFISLLQINYFIMSPARLALLYLPSPVLAAVIFSLNE